MTHHKHLQRLDKRGQKSWHAIRNAFVDLVLSKRYDEIKVSEIIKKSGVARSTFYEHFNNKDAILAQSLYPPMSRLANCIRRQESLEPLQAILQHFWENRSFCRLIMTGSPRKSVVSTLVDLINREIESVIKNQKIKLLISPRHAAIQIAESQLALMNAWLLGEVQSNVKQLAEAMHKTSNSLFNALMIDTQ